MRSAVPFQFTSFFMVGRGESFTTMSRSFNKDSSAGPRVCAGTAAPEHPAKGSPFFLAPAARPASAPLRLSASRAPWAGGQHVCSAFWILPLQTQAEGN